MEKNEHSVIDLKLLNRNIFVPYFINHFDKEKIYELTMEIQILRNHLENEFQLLRRLKNNLDLNISKKIKNLNI